MTTQEMVQNGIAVNCEGQIFVNGTPHAISVAKMDGEIVNWAANPAGQIRCTTSTPPPTERFGFSVSKGQTFEDVTMPESEEGVVWILSALAFQSATRMGRTDVVMFDSTKSVKWTTEDAPSPQEIGRVRWQGGFIGVI